MQTCFSSPAQLWRAPSQRQQAGSATCTHVGIYAIFGRWLRKKAAPLPAAAPAPPPAVHDWGTLIEEFEERAVRASPSRGRPPPAGVELGEEERRLHELTPSVEVGAMSALVLVMWKLGRMLRLDSFLVMWYPLPILYLALRWGPRVADKGLLASVFLIFTMMGPMFSILYFLNTGVMTAALARALWWRWAALPTAVFGGLAKGLGLAAQFSYMTPILKENSWDFVAFQCKALVENVLGFMYWACQAGSPPALSLYWIRVAVAVVLILHSIVHVALTWLGAVMILDRVGDGVKLKRKVRLPWILHKLKQAAMESNRNRYRRR